MVLKARHFEALKVIRSLLPVEDRLTGRDCGHVVESRGVRQGAERPAPLRHGAAGTSLLKRTTAFATATSAWGRFEDRNAGMGRSGTIADDRLLRTTRARHRCRPFRKGFA